MRECAVCANEIKVVRYTDKSYSGGHYFFDVPIISKKEFRRAVKDGVKKKMMGEIGVSVYKKEPKPYKYVEYWECPKCFYRGKIKK